MSERDSDDYPSPEDVPWETCQVWEFLHGVSADTDPADLPYWSDPSFAGRVDELRRAAVCLSRYLDWCKAAGLDY